MQIKTSSIPSLNFSQLPAFADFILQHKLKDFVNEQLRISRQINLPLLKYLKGMTDEEIVKMSMGTSGEFFQFLIDNKAEEYIKISTERWVANQLPIIEQNQVEAEDITLLSFVRKQALMLFLPDYCDDTDQLIDIIKEIDWYIQKSEAVATNTFIKLFKSRLDEHAHLIQKITNTSPGAIYVFDVIEHKGIYSNNKLANVFGYSQEELNKWGIDAIDQLVHPDDIKIIKKHRSNIPSLKDGEIKSYKYRIKNKNEKYQWVRHFESVFKRTEDGKVWQVIGIALDIDKEKKIAVQLKESEAQLLEAQEIAQMGSFVWDLQKNSATVTPQTVKILEVENDFEKFISKVHPDDKQKVEAAIKQSIETGNFECEYRYLGEKEEKIIWSKGVITYKNNEPACMQGTVIDVTEKQKLLQKLQRSDELYKQAQAVSHIGNWVMNLKEQKLTWSDELYRIYALEPGSEISHKSIAELNHPDDARLVEEEMKTAIENRSSFNFNYRIILPDGSQKDLLAKGEPVLNINGECLEMFGTVQDVTERQNLIHQLQQTEALYKQAEVLAKMGNWNWNVKKNKIDWTNELYKIYGLEPQSEEITIERFLSFIHPEDKAQVEEGIKDLAKKDFLDYTFRIITAKNEIKTIRSIAQIQKDEKGNTSFVVGTEQDITERQQLIEKLQKSETLYKQAQSLSHIGNWSWNIKTGKIEWSEELYSIYEISDSEELTFDAVSSYVHPDDREQILFHLNNSATKGIQYDRYHRIITRSGKIKTIHRKATVELDTDGTPLKLIGTTQDITERHELIKKLQESDALFKQAQSIAHIGNWTWELKNNKISWTDELYQIYGLEPQSKEITVELFLSYVHPEDLENLQAHALDAIEKKHPFEVYYRNLLEDGTVKILHARGEFLLSKSGRPYRVVGTVQDVTEQQRIQQELSDNQTFLRKLTDATPSIITSYNINTGKYVFVSEGVEKLLGYSAKEVMEKGIEVFTKIIHPEDATAVMQKNTKALEEANANKDIDLIVEFIYRMRHKDGEYRWFHTYGTIFDRNINGFVEHILNISLDITEQIEATKKIEEQEHFIQQVADASPTILYLFDVKKDGIAYANREIFYVLEYTPEEIINFSPDELYALYHPDDISLLPERALTSKSFHHPDSMIQYECRMKAKDGTWKWLLIREIIFKRDEDGNILQLLGAALDITKRKEMEQTLLQNSFQLEQSNASLEEFAYIASHDLKEPLRKISTFGDRLVSTQLERLSDDGKIYLTKIVDASQRMQLMINDLLSISMISGDRSFQTTSLQSILDEVLQTLEYKIEQKNAEIKSAPLPEASIVPSQFRQLFQNIISNSLKFVKENVQPVIKISHQFISPAEVANLQLSAAEKYHKLDFVDNGIGFEEEYAGKIFAIFQRLHGRSEYEGTGIGLAICKKIVEHHGGAIYASAVPGEGATFTIILPA